MPAILSWPSALTAISSFAIQSAYAEPEALRLDLVDAMGQIAPIDRVIAITEAIYAARDVASSDARALAQSLVDFCMIDNFHNMAGSGRGVAMKAALARGSFIEGDVPVLPRYTPAPTMLTPDLPVEGEP